MRRRSQREDAQDEAEDERKKPTRKKVAVKKHQPKKASLAVPNSAAMGALASGCGTAHQSFVRDPARANDGEPVSFVSMLNDASVKLDEVPLEEDYENGENGMDDGGMEEGVDEDGDDDELQEIEEEVFDGAVPPKVNSVRTASYIEIEDVALIKAWESVSLDAVTGTDQTGKRY